MGLGKFNQYFPQISDYVGQITGGGSAAVFGNAYVLPVKSELIGYSVKCSAKEDNPTASVVHLLADGSSVDTAGLTIASGATAATVVQDPTILDAYKILAKNTVLTCNQNTSSGKTIDKLSVVVYLRALEP